MKLYTNHPQKLLCCVITCNDVLTCKMELKSLFSLCIVCDCLCMCCDVYVLCMILCMSCVSVCASDCVLFLEHGMILQVGWSQGIREGWLLVGKITKYQCYFWVNCCCGRFCMKQWLLFAHFWSSTLAACMRYYQSYCYGFGMLVSWFQGCSGDWSQKTPLGSLSLQSYQRRGQAFQTSVKSQINSN
jgi:hypothetical protein